MINATTAAQPQPQKKLVTCEPMDRQPHRPTLRLTPYAWAKLLFLRDLGTTEIGGFGISTAGDPLLLEDVRLVRQQCDWASVKFDDVSVADLFDEQVDEGRSPEEFGRIWVHTHPGACPKPSRTDEETFQRVFGGCDWTIMFILAKSGATYARLRFGVGPGGSLEIPLEIDFNAPFSASRREAWSEEYAACVEAAPESLESAPNYADPDAEQFDPWEAIDDFNWANLEGETAYDRYF